MRSFVRGLRTKDIPVRDIEFSTFNKQNAALHDIALNYLKDSVDQIFLERIYEKSLETHVEKYFTSRPFSPCS